MNYRKAGTLIAFTFFAAQLAWGQFTVCTQPFGDQPPKDSGSPCNSAQCSAGEPVAIATGQVFEAVTDYSTAGQNKLQLVRYYASRFNPAMAASLTDIDWGLGFFWKTNYNRRLGLTFGTNPMGFTIITAFDAERADGAVYHFVNQSTTDNNGPFTATDPDVAITATSSGGGFPTFTLTDTDDTVETYTTIGGFVADLVKITARNGYTQTIDFHVRGLYGSAPETVTDSYGRVLTFNYDSSSGSLKLISILTPDGTTISYGFDASQTTSGAATDRLISVTYPSPTATQNYSYGAKDSIYRFDLMGITDENGVTWQSWTYDNFQRALTSTTGTGTAASTTSFSYSSTAYDRTVTSPSGLVETYHFSMLQNALKITRIDRAATTPTPAMSKTFTYDTNGYLASVTDWFTSPATGHLTSYTNDSKGQPTKIIEDSACRPRR